MTEERIQEYEKQFGKDSYVLEMMDLVGYDKMPYSQRALLWQALAEHLKTKYNHVVPGTEKQEESEEECQLRLEKEARRSAEELRESVQELKKIGVQRIHLADVDEGTCLTCSVLNPLPAMMRQCKLPSSGKLEVVDYDMEVAKYKAVQFSNHTVGLSTSAMGDCIGVMFLVGHPGRGNFKNGYWGGSLAHLPGGEDKNLPWKKMVFDLDAMTLRRYLQDDPLYAQALICLTPDRLRNSPTVRNIIRDKILPLGFSVAQIMVYVGPIPGFGLLRTGAFGTTGE